MLGLALLKKHQVDYNLLATMHADNINQSLETCRFLRVEVGTPPRTLIKDIVFIVCDVFQDNST